MATDLSGSKIDFFHIFHVQLFEHTDGTGVFKAAFETPDHESPFL